PRRSCRPPCLLLSELLRAPVAPCRCLHGTFLSSPQLSRVALPGTLALGRVVGELCVHYIAFLLAIDLFALLATAATDRALLLDAEVGDAATGAGDGLAPEDHADGHAQHHQQHQTKYQNPGHGDSPSPKRRV